MNQEKLDAFMAVYAGALRHCIETQPDKYAYGVDKIPTVLARMQPAIVSGSYNHDSPAFKATCKQLGIKHTRKAIKAFLTGES